MCLFSGVHKKCREMNVGRSNHTWVLNIAEELWSGSSLFMKCCCGHMTHTPTQPGAVCWDSLTLNFHPHSITPHILGSGMGAKVSPYCQHPGQGGNEAKVQWGPSLEPSRGCGRGRRLLGRHSLQFFLLVLHYPPFLPLGMGMFRS